MTDTHTSDDVEPAAADSAAVGSSAPERSAVEPSASTDGADTTATSDDAVGRGDHGESSNSSGAARTRDRTHRARRRPSLLVVALALGLVAAVALTVVWWVTRPTPGAGLLPAQQAAVDAARQEAVNLQTFRRASFEADFDHALAGMTPEFGQNLSSRKDALQQQLTTNNIDVTANALSAGLVTGTASQATVLVVTNSQQVNDSGTTTPFVFSRFQITMQLTGGKWLLSDLTNVGLS